MRILLITIVGTLLLPQTNPLAAVKFTAPAGGYAIVRFKTTEARPTTSATAVELMIDGRSEQIVVLTPGAGRPRYEALVGPLTAGSHDARFRASPLWKWDPTLSVEDVSVDVVSTTDARFDVLANAPAIGLRPDTIGTASDLPLMMYVEDSTEGASRWLRYSIIFSHEDGGTPGVALMARWGRTTDIELAYEVELRNGRAVQARYQGPDHRVIANERLDVVPPTLLVSTLNNMFLDRGHSAAIVRMRPIPVNLAARSRESVMDDEPWTYRVMARELAAERPAGVGDPRDYVYVDLRLETRAAGIALGARSGDGTIRWSDRGRPELLVSRQGEVRIAIPTSIHEVLTSLLVRCDPKPEPGQPGDRAECRAELRNAFRLDTDHQPGPTLVGATRLNVESGTAREIPFAADKIKR